MTARTIVLNGFDTVPNDSFLYKNFMKGYGSEQSSGGYAYPANLDANGYPTIGSVGTDFSGTFYKPSAYAGTWRMSWKGKCKLNISPTQAPNSGFTVVSDPGGVVQGTPSFTMTVLGGGSSSTTTFVDFTYNGVGSTVQVVFKAAGDFTGFSDLRMVRMSAPYTGDFAAVDGGIPEEQFNQDFLTAITAINPPIIRGLDISPVNGSLLSRAAYSTPVAGKSYCTPLWFPGLWAGVAASGDGVTYTCSAAPDFPSGAYVDGEMIQVQIQFANTSTTPTLNVAGRGAKTIATYNSNATGPPDTLGVGALATNALWTFMYDGVSGKFVLTGGGGVTRQAPLAVHVALCNKLNRDLWWLIPFQYNNASITTDITYIRDHLNANLNCYFEYCNEIWNFAFAQTNMATARGVGQGFVTANGRAFHGWTGLRFAQIDDLIRPTWTATRSGSQLRGILTHQLAGDINTKTYRFEGTDLGSFGYATVGNRPADKAYAIGGATYTSGSLIRGGGDYSSGYTAGEIAGLTGAADNYASGTPSLMQSALDWIYNDHRAGTKNGVTGSATISNITTLSTTWNGYAAGYGRYVIMYEGNYQGLAPTTAQCTSVFGISTAYSASIQNLINAYKNDVRCSIAMNGLYRQFFALSQARYAASYVFGNNPQWGLQPGGGDLASSYWQTRGAVVLVNAGLRRLMVKT